MNNTTRRHPRTMRDAFLVPPKRDTTFQGPYRAPRKVDPHRVVGWLCLAGLILVLMLGIGAGRAKPATFRKLEAPGGIPHLRPLRAAQTCTSHPQNPPF